MTLGISVDITKAAVASASLVIAQVNRYMPRVHGDAYVHVDEVDFIVPHDEPLLEYAPRAPDEIAAKIGKHVARLIEDGDTLQVGYGKVPNAILAHLRDKRHLGIHTELLTDGMVDLIRAGVVDNSRKNLDPGKTVAAFCMGTQEAYDYLHDNQLIEFRPADYTNNPLVIARHNNMVSINGALEIDLTGQVTAESIGPVFYSGIGGSADFVRGAGLAPGGRTIIALASTARGGTVSRIVPFLEAGAGVTLGRGDIQYVVTEYGCAYLPGKNIRERAMDLIAIAHPRFREGLIAEAKKRNLIYRDQVYIPGERGQYPEALEAYRTTRTGLRLFLRPVKISDETLFKELFYALSEETIRRRFFRLINMPHSDRQKFFVIDYQEKMAIVAIVQAGDREIAVGVGRYIREPEGYTAAIMLLVRDDYQNQGVGRELFAYLIYLAKRQGLLAFTGEVLLENKPMLHLLQHFEKTDLNIEKDLDAGAFRMNLAFKAP